jgi:hypothetical protein
MGEKKNEEETSIEPWSCDFTGGRVPFDERLLQEEG